MGPTLSLASGPCPGHIRAELIAYGAYRGQVGRGSACDRGFALDEALTAALAGTDGVSRDLREMLDWAIGQAPLNIALLDTQMRQVRLNASMCRMLGLETEAAGLGLRLTDMISNPDTESCVACARQVARTGEPALWKGPSPG
jgi:PAS domain-containing protein